MKHNISAVLASALVALAVSAPVLAQGPGGGGPGGGGGFGGQRRMPFAFGAVSAVDPTAGTITITPQFGGNGPQTIKVGTDIQITTQTTATVADLKVGDQIAVQGVPTGITAAQIIAGPPPAGLPGAGGRGGAGGPRGGGGNGGNGANGAANQAYATAMGTIKTLPTDAAPALVINMGTNMTLSLTVPAATKITKYSTLALTGVKVGDQVMAAGQAADDGTFTASAVGVNLQMGGGFGGPGGFGRGRRGGGGGFGGGGFGGPGGGGGFGGGGGNGGPPPPAPDGGAPPPPVQ